MKRLVLGLLLLAMATVVHAQTLTGSLTGVIKDESGAALPGVTATATSPSMPGGPAVATTANTGEYRLTGLPPGTYTLTLAIPGFATYQEEGLRVNVGGTLERNVTLKVSALQETVTVNGESPMVDTRQSAVEHTVTNEFIENVQNQRYSVQEYAKWSPGVSAADPGGTSQSVSVMGSAISESAYLLDGVTTNNTRSGGFYQASDVDAIEEVNIQTLGASAEYAIAQGAVFSTVIKSGTNKFSGTASAVYGPNSWFSRPVKVSCNCPSGLTGFNRLGTRDYSFHLGGPILRDRLWFFGGGAIWQRRQGAPGTDPALLTFWNTDDRMTGKITWKVSNRWSLNSYVMIEPYIAFGQSTRTQPESVLSPARYAYIPTYGNELTNQLSNSTLLTIRIGGTGEANVFRHPSNGDLVTPNHLDLATGIQSGGAQFIQRTHTFRNSQSVKLDHYIQGSGVSQQVRGGFQTERAYDRGEFAWPSGVQYQDLNGAPNQAQFRSPWRQGARFINLGFWAEDQLTIKQRLTLNLGARWDRLHAISQDLSGVDLQLHPTGNAIPGLGSLFTWKVASPRLGFSLKLTDDGKTTMRGDYGRAYRQIFLGDYSTLHPAVSAITLKRFDPATAGYSTVLSVTDPLANVTFDRDIKAPYTDQYAIGLDRQLATNVAVSVSYVHKNGRNQVGWRDIGGVYGNQSVTLPNGQTITVFPLLSSTASRRFQVTNGPGYFSRYNGLLVTFTKRLSNGLQASVAYTESRTKSLQTGTTANPNGAGVLGQDPNDYINRAGPDTGIDRPHMLTSQATYTIRPIALLVSANVQLVSGLPFIPTALVPLPQGTRTVNIAPPGGDYRLPHQNIVAMRFSKLLPIGNGRKVELIANVNNILQSKAYSAFATTNFFSSSYGQPTTWVEPRNMNVMAKLSW